LIIFAATLALHLTGGVHRAPSDARPAAEQAERTVTAAEREDALAFYRDLISRLETVDLNSPEAVSARLGVRFVPDPRYQPGRHYRHWLAMVPAGRHRPATRIEYFAGPGPHTVNIIPLGWRSTQSDFIAIYPAMSLRPSTAFSGPPEVEFDLPGGGNEIILSFSQVEPHRLRAVFFRSRRGEPAAG
jgi:hypothetical protein